MEKWLCWGSLGVSGFLLFLFVLDLPPLSLSFGGMGWMVDIIGIIACGLVAYLAWDSFQEIR